MPDAKKIRGSTNVPWLRLILLIIGVVALDRITKAMVSAAMSPGQMKPVLGDFFRLTFVQNPGGAFGTRFGGNLFYIIAALIAATVLVVWLLRKWHLTFGFAGISLMLGGAAGNLWDRATVGVVVDFLDFGIGSTRWPTFNIADSAITIGIVLLILQEFFFANEKPCNIAVESGSDNDTAAQDK